MVNSGSFDTDEDRNEKSRCLPANVATPGSESASTCSMVDNDKQVDSDLPPASAIEPNPSKTETNSKNLFIENTEHAGLSYHLSLVQTGFNSNCPTSDRSVAESKLKRSRKLLCLYCDRSFVSVNLRQKHVERVHILKPNRRVSARRQNQLSSTTCIYCDKLNASEHTLHVLFQHLVEEHPGKYFGCLFCGERYLTSSNLAEHNSAKHSMESIENKRNFPVTTQNEEMKEDAVLHNEEVSLKVTRSKLRSRSNDPSKIETNSDLPIIKKKSKLKELRNKKISVKTSKIALKRSKRLQAQAVERETQKKKREKKVSGTNKSELSNNSKQTEKSKNSCVNPYPEFDNFYRVKKITDHSIDNLKISSLTFDDVFDKAFFNRIKCNIEENLSHHIDGKLFKNEESESRISNFEKISTQPQEVHQSSSENYGCELSLNAITPVPSLLLNSQFGEDFESQIEYGSKPSKKKTQTKSDEVHYKYFTRRKYQASILQQKENRDLSKLDMWTQMVVKDRQEKVMNKEKNAKEIQDYTSGQEYKNKIRREELNRILDRRGPFEDLKEEATKKAAFDKLNSLSENNVSQEVFTDVREVLNDILNKVFESVREDYSLQECIKEIDHREIPAYLDLRRKNSSTLDEIDKSDRIALICSSQETENYELPTNPVRGKNELVELTGEWARSRMYICAACGVKFSNMKYLIEHKSVYHQNVWVQNYEFVGNQSELYRHLSIPGLGKVGFIEETIPCKQWKRSDARTCTKCGRVCNSLGELHRHVLECGGDWTWALARKKCKYRPFGAKSRRKRRGLMPRTNNKQKTEPIERKNSKKNIDSPRQRPSDADTIQRMLANLPAKRPRRSLISLRDVVFKSRKTRKGSKNQNTKLKCGKTISKNQTDSFTPNTIQQRNRRSMRSLNKVLSSRILDLNSSLMVKRKLQAFRDRRSSTGHLNSTVKAPNSASNDSEKGLEISKCEPLSYENDGLQKKHSDTNELNKIDSKNILNDRKKAMSKKMITSRLNIKSFFPIKKKNAGSKQKFNLDQLSTFENEITVNENISGPNKSSSYFENIKKNKRGGLKGFVRALSLRKRNSKENEHTEKQKKTVKLKSEVSVSTPPKKVGRPRTNQATSDKSGTVVDNKVEISARSTDSNKAEVNTSKKRKVDPSVKNVINKVKKNKTDNSENKLEKKSFENTHTHPFLEEKKKNNIALEEIKVKVSEERDHVLIADESIVNEKSDLVGVISEDALTHPINIQEKPYPNKYIMNSDVSVSKVSDDVSVHNENSLASRQSLGHNTTPVTIDTSSQPKCVPLISPNLKGKIRKPNRGLNDCIAMLTNKLQQKEEKISSSLESLFSTSSTFSTERTENLNIIDRPLNHQKNECILKIPSFKATKSPVTEEVALDLSKKSLSSPNLLYPFSNNSGYIESTINKVIEGVIENKCKEVLNEKITTPKWSSIDDIIQQVVENTRTIAYNKYNNKKNSSNSRTHVDDTIDFVVNSSSDWFETKLNSEEGRRKPSRKPRKRRDSDDNLIKDIILGKDKLIIAPFSKPHNALENSLIAKIKENESKLPSASDTLDDQIDKQWECRIATSYAETNTICHLNTTTFSLLETKKISEQPIKSLAASEKFGNDNTMTSLHFGDKSFEEFDDQSKQSVNLEKTIHEDEITTDRNTNQFSHENILDDNRSQNNTCKENNKTEIVTQMHTDSVSNLQIQSTTTSKTDNFSNPSSTFNSQSELQGINSAVETSLEKDDPLITENSVKSLNSDSDDEVPLAFFAKQEEKGVQKQNIVLNLLKNASQQNEKYKDINSVCSNLEEKIQDKTNDASKISNYSSNIVENVTGNSKENIEHVDKKENSLTSKGKRRKKRLQTKKITKNKQKIISDTDVNKKHKVYSSVSDNKSNHLEPSEGNGSCNNLELPKEDQSELPKEEAVCNELVESVSGFTKLLESETNINEQSNLSINSKKTRRKSKSFRKADKIDNDLFKDFSLVINRKTKRIPPTSIVDDSVCEDVLDKSIDILPKICEVSDTDRVKVSESTNLCLLNDSVEEIDMEIEEIPINTNIIERNNEQVLTEKCNERKDEIFDVTMNSQNEKDNTTRRSPRKKNVPTLYMSLKSDDSMKEMTEITLGELKNKRKNQSKPSNQTSEICLTDLEEQKSHIIARNNLCLMDSSHFENQDSKRTDIIDNIPRKMDSNEIYSQQNNQIEKIFVENTQEEPLYTIEKNTLVAVANNTGNSESNNDKYNKSCTTEDHHLKASNSYIKNDPTIKRAEQNEIYVISKDFLNKTEINYELSSNISSLKVPNELSAGCFDLVNTISYTAPELKNVNGELNYKNNIPECFPLQILGQECRRTAKPTIKCTISASLDNLGCHSEKFDKNVSNSETSVPSLLGNELSSHVDHALLKNDDLQNVQSSPNSSENSLKIQKSKVEPKGQQSNESDINKALDDCLDKSEPSSEMLLLAKDESSKCPSNFGKPLDESTPNKEWFKKSNIHYKDELSELINEDELKSAELSNQSLICLEKFRTTTEFTLDNVSEKRFLTDIIDKDAFTEQAETRYSKSMDMENPVSQSESDERIVSKTESKKTTVDENKQDGIPILKSDVDLETDSDNYTKCDKTTKIIVNSSSDNSRIVEETLTEESFVSKQRSDSYKIKDIILSIDNPEEGLPSPKNINDSGFLEKSLEISFEKKQNIEAIDEKGLCFEGRDDLLLLGSENSKKRFEENHACAQEAPLDEKLTTEFSGSISSNSKRKRGDKKFKNKFKKPKKRLKSRKCIISRSSTNAMLNSSDEKNGLICLENLNEFLKSSGDSNSESMIQNFPCNQNVFDENKSKKSVNHINMKFLNNVSEINDCDLRWNKSSIRSIRRSRRNRVNQRRNFPINESQFENEKSLDIDVPINGNVMEEKAKLNGAYHVDNDLSRTSNLCQGGNKLKGKSRRTRKNINYNEENMEKIAIKCAENEGVKELKDSSKGWKQQKCKNAEKFEIDESIHKSVDSNDLLFGNSDKVSSTINEVEANKLVSSNWKNNDENSDILNKNENLIKENNPSLSNICAAADFSDMPKLIVDLELIDEKYQELLMSPQYDKQKENPGIAASNEENDQTESVEENAIEFYTEISGTDKKDDTGELGPNSYSISEQEISSNKDSINLDIDNTSEDTKTKKHTSKEETVDKVESGEVLDNDISEDTKTKKHTSKEETVDKVESGKVLDIDISEDSETKKYTSEEETVNDKVESAEVLDNTKLYEIASDKSGNYQSRRDRRSRKNINYNEDNMTDNTKNTSSKVEKQTTKNEYLCKTKDRKRNIRNLLKISEEMTNDGKDPSFISPNSTLSRQNRIPRKHIGCKEDESRNNKLTGFQDKGDNSDTITSCEKKDYHLDQVETLISENKKRKSKNTRSKKIENTDNETLNIDSSQVKEFDNDNKSEKLVSSKMESYLTNILDVRTLTSDNTAINTSDSFQERELSEDILNVNDILLSDTYNKQSWESNKYKKNTKNIMDIDIANILDTENISEHRRSSRKKNLNAANKQINKELDSVQKNILKLELGIGKNNSSDTNESLPLLDRMTKIFKDLNVARNKTINFSSEKISDSKNHLTISSDITTCKTDIEMCISPKAKVTTATSKNKKNGTSQKNNEKELEQEQEAEIIGVSNPEFLKTDETQTFISNSNVNSPIQDNVHLKIGRLKNENLNDEIIGNLTNIEIKKLDSGSIVDMTLGKESTELLKSASIKDIHINNRPKLHLTSSQTVFTSISKSGKTSKNRNVEITSQIEPFTDIITSSEMDIAPVLDEIDRSLENEDIYDFNEVGIVESQAKISKIINRKTNEPCQTNSTKNKDLVKSVTEPTKKIPKRSAKDKALENIHEKSLNTVMGNDSQECLENIESVCRPSIIEGSIKSNITTDLDVSILNAEVDNENSYSDILSKTKENSLNKSDCSQQELNDTPLDILEQYDQTEMSTDGQELRRSRRGSRKVASYNENDLIDPLIDALETRRNRPVKKDRSAEKLHVKKDVHKELFVDKPKLSSEELFDRLKNSSYENGNSVSLRSQNTLKENHIEPISVSNSNNECLDNVLDKPSGLIKDIDRIYEFTEDSDENTKQEFSKKRKSAPNQLKLIDTAEVNSVIHNNPESSSDVLKERDESKKSNYCEICNKTFIRIENLIKHKTTLTHISKLSELEAKQAEEKAKAQNNQSSQNQSDFFEPSEFLRDEINIRDILHQSEKNEVNAPEISPVIINNHHLNLVDIISDVLNKPVLENYKSAKQSYSEDNSNCNTRNIGRCKSLGERKSFDSESLSRIGTPLAESCLPSESKTTILEKQINLLENIIGSKIEHLEANKSEIGHDNYIDDVSSCSINTDISGIENKSFTSYKSSYNPQTEKNITSFIKPNQYEEISEDSSNIRVYEDSKLRKTLNRDEELFLECCSLLKSGSEVSNSNYTKSLKNNINTRTDLDKPNSMKNKKLIQTVEEAHAYSDNSRTPTPLGDTYDDDASNSNTISSNWNLKSERPLDKNRSFSFEEVVNKEESGISFGEILTKGLRNQFEYMNQPEERVRDDQDQLQKDDSDSSNRSKKISTKGARKIFEGLKVSIPTEDLNLDVLNSNIINKQQELKDFSTSNENQNILHKPRSTRKSKPVKKSQVGSNLLFKVNKRKSSYQTTNDTSNNKEVIYNFEDTQDNGDIFTKTITNVDKETVLLESDNESLGYADSIGADAKSVSSVSSISTMSCKKSEVTPENITKKKYKIMGKIFRNAAKYKLDDIDEELRNIPEIPEIDNIELVENYVRSCQRVKSPFLPPPPPPPLDELPKKPKMTEEEMNLLFDQLLGKETNQLKQEKQANRPSLNKVKCDSKTGDSRKKNNKVRNRKRFRTNSESSDDEFNISKTTKKRTNKKNNQEDSGINLELELKECIGVASRKSQRKCTSGKQNVLVEYWSSDEEAFEAMLDNQKNKIKKIECEKKSEEKQTVSEELTEDRLQNQIGSVEKSTKSKPLKRKSNKKNKTLRIISNSQGVAVSTTSRRKRAAVNPLYHWSSSSEDEAQSLIEVKPVREEDEEDRPVQHGWIVGDSPKKLVTMLALTKGKKTDIDNVKEQSKRRTSNPVS